MKFYIDFYYISECQGNSAYKATIYSEKYVEDILLVELLTGIIYSVFHPNLDKPLIKKEGESLKLYKDKNQICEKEI